MRCLDASNGTRTPAEVNDDSRQCDGSNLDSERAWRRVVEYSNVKHIPF